MKEKTIAGGRPSHFAVTATLTTRELQILDHAAQGRDNKVIAYELGITHSTVKVLLARAAARLGVRTRSELIALYSREARTADNEASSE